MHFDRLCEAVDGNFGKVNMSNFKTAYPDENVPNESLNKSQIMEGFRKK